MDVVLDTYRALKPTVEGMQSLMKYTYSSTHRIADTFEKFCMNLSQADDYTYIPSSPFLLKMGELFGLFLDIDAAKNMKGSINNDVSFIKRYLVSITPAL